jgi:hypothetical protein
MKDTMRLAVGLMMAFVMGALVNAQQKPQPPVDEQALKAEVNAFMDQYWQLFSAGQIDQLVERIYHPSGQLNNQGTSSIEEMKKRFPDSRKALLAGGYGRSNMPKRNICLLTPTLAIISGRGMRYLKDGNVMGEYGWTYTIAKGPTGWKMLSILSHDPNTFVTCSKEVS